jgi:asparagine synthase (glutamine-hydrolysing)
MCGFAGFIHLGSRQAADNLRATVRGMTDTLLHRGPDDEGVWVDSEAGVALGHRRLSVIDLSPEGRQPMQSACGRYVIAFNGEIYNFRQIRKELEAESEVRGWRGHSDTEVMLAAFSTWGFRKALERFNGMFAFALWDRSNRCLYLARDRLGEKPLYYGGVGNSFVFVSELKALKAHPGFRPEVDRGALALYVRHAYVPAPYSIYKGIRKLPSGAWLEVPGKAVAQGRCGALEPARYWSARQAAESGIRDPFRGDPHSAVDELDHLLRDAIALRMEADVPLGAFLSGGIDSSTVVALMQTQSTRPVKTFTIGFREEGYNEAAQANQVAAHLGTEHTELYVTPDEAQTVIADLPYLYDEPFADPSQIPTFLVAGLARKQVTVSLSGDGGDELFGGYNRYFWGWDIWRKIGWAPGWARRRAAKALTAFPPRVWSALLKPLERWIPAEFRVGDPGDRLLKLAGLLSVADPEEIYRGLVCQWKDPTSVVMGASEPATALTDRTQWASVGNLINRMMYLDTVTYLPDDILVKIDRATMGVSLEARVPMLDHRVVEFAWRIPLGMKLRQGHGKWLLRQVLYRYLPKSLVERPKMGFGVPIDEWLRGPLREWAADLLNEKRLVSEGFFNPQPIRQKWNEHQSRTRNWQYYLWNILMFQAWLVAQGGGACVEVGTDAPNGSVLGRFGLAGSA